jgi:excisionase family DNA binding protein
MNSDDTMINTLTLQIQPVFIQAIGDHVIERLKPIIGKMKQEDDAILNVKGLAEYMNVDENWIYQRTRKKEIPFIKKGKYCMFRKSAIDAWLNQDAIKPLSPFTLPKKT